MVIGQLQYCTAVIIGYERNGYKRHGYKERGFERHGYKEYGYKGYGYKEHGYKDKGIRSTGIKYTGMKDTDMRYGHKGHVYKGHFSCSKYWRSKQIHSVIRGIKYKVHNRWTKYDLYIQASTIHLRVDICHIKQVHIEIIQEPQPIRLILLIY